MKRRIIGLLLGFGLFPISLRSAVEHLLPRPQRLEVAGGEPFRTRSLRIVSQADSLRVAKWCGRHGVQVTTKSTSPLFEMYFQDSIPGACWQKEAYSLMVDDGGIRIRAVTSTGLLRALQTLDQLAEGMSRKGLCLEQVRIVDWPAFRVRGFMLDVGRGFMPVAQLKRHIDLLSRFKVNVFHFHLTEDLAWRLQSKRFPALNADSNFARLPGCYYTLEEARDLEKFCKERGVCLLPEIEMPGHSAVFTKAMGCDMQSPEGMEKLKQVIEEVCREAFPESPYLHIGTDETHLYNPNFVSDMVAYVHSLGKRVVAWSPGARYGADRPDVLQLWSSRGRLVPGIPCIDSRYHYLNHFDTYADVAGIYRSTVCGQSTGDSCHAGVIMAVWNDRNLPRSGEMIAQNGLYAAVLAMAERAWLGGGQDYLTRSGVNLPPRNTDTFREFADWERRFLYHKEHVLARVPIPYVKQTNMRWRVTQPFPNDGDTAAVFPPEQQEPDTVYFYDCELIQTFPADGAGIYLRHVWGDMVPAFWKGVQPNQTAYAYTYVFSPRKQWVGAQISFHDYSRSEADIPPRPGTWDYKGSRVWVNGKELLPPVWTNRHTWRDTELPLMNENFSARSPYPVLLKKGWNLIMLKLPVGDFSSEAIRLETWAFTFALTTPDGRQAMPGLVYSPDMFAGPDP